MIAAREREPGVIATLQATPTAVRYLLGGVVINQMGAFIQPFLVLYLVHKGLPAGQAGVALGVYSLGATAGLALGGDLNHRIGSRWTIALAMATSALLVITVPWLSGPGLYVVLLVVIAAAGAATQAYRPAAGALLSDLMPEQHRIMSFSMFRIALNIGAAAGSLLAVLLIALDWDLLFWFNGFTALAYSGLAIALLPRTSADHARQETEAAEAPAAKSGYGVVLRDVRFLVYLASMLLSAVVYIQFYAVLPLKISAEGNPTALYNAVLILDSVLLITCELKITTYTRRGVASVVGGIGTTMLALGFAGYGLPFASAALIVVSTMVYVFGIMISGPTMFAFPAKKPSAVKGRYIGASQAMFSLGSAAGPALGTLAWSHIGNAIWPLCGVVGLVAAACAVIGMREPREPAPAG